jgi:hypothetical protein
MNPYDRYFGKEDWLQIATKEYLDEQYPKILYTHIPNEGKRSAFERYKAKRSGMRAGMPDIMIFAQRLSFAGLAIELKIKPNKPSVKQLDILERLSSEGWLAYVCYDFDGVKKMIDAYLKQEIDGLQ